MDERTIGATIRQLRTAAGVTLTALAKKAELTKSTLSKIENGQISSPIATLIRLADALDVPLSQFFNEPHADPAYVLTRKGKGKIITQDGSRFGYAYEGLALDMRHKFAEPFILTIQPDDPAGEFRHGGEEFIYLLSGRMKFTLADEEFILNPGDSIYFDPTHLHKTQVLGKKPARFICVFVQKAHGGRRRK